MTKYDPMTWNAGQQAFIDQFTRGLTALDQQFQTLALDGDERAQSMQSILSGVRSMWADGNWAPRVPRTSPSRMWS